MPWSMAAERLGERRLVFDVEDWDACVSCVAICTMPLSNASVLHFPAGLQLAHCQLLTLLHIRAQALCSQTTMMMTTPARPTT